MPQRTPHGVGVDEPALGRVLRHLRPALRDGYLDQREVLLMSAYQEFEHDVLENIEQFKPQEEPQLPIPGLKMQKQEPDLNRYQVNLVVDNGANQGAPVVIESNPTYANLVGHVERRAQFGALLTDFTMIRAGSLAKANGGYLVLDIEDVLRSPFSYDALKRALQNREVRVEDNAERPFDVGHLRLQREHRQRDLEQVFCSTCFADIEGCALPQPHVPPCSSK